MVEQWDIELQHISAEEHLVNILTKGLGGHAHNKLVKLMRINLSTCDTFAEEKC